MTDDLTKHEPPPQKSVHSAVWDLVKQDIEERDAYGLKKYGQRLKPFDGRDALVDIYQEQLDSIVYTRKLIEERKKLRELAQAVLDAGSGIPSLAIVLPAEALARAVLFSLCESPLQSSGESKAYRGEERPSLDGHAFVACDGGDACQYGLVCHHRVPGSYLLCNRKREEH